MSRLISLDMSAIVIPRRLPERWAVLRSELHPFPQYQLTGCRPAITLASYESAILLPNIQILSHSPMGLLFLNRPS
jgi:hypothetical protein